jgi:ribonuclease HII
MKKRRYPDFRYERQLWKKKFKFVAGVDEVGRGCFAGPIVASAVALAPMTNVQFPIINEDRDEIYINDSKKLTARQREIAEKWIKENAVMWGVGETSVAEINRFGMAKATNMAFRRAVGAANRRLHERIEYLLIDAFYIPYTRGFPAGRKLTKNHKNKVKHTDKSRQLAINNGDEKSVSIAAASIVAKVYRDSLMRKVGARRPYRKYDWMSNKGYATEIHREAILRHGISRHHRKQFVETFLKGRKEV